jgi:hypothetical protein
VKSIELRLAAHLGSFFDLEAKGFCSISYWIAQRITLRQDEGSVA